MAASLTPPISGLAPTSVSHELSACGERVTYQLDRSLDEVGRAEFFRKGGAARDLVRGKRWLLLTSRLNLDRGKRRQLNALFALNRRILKAYLLKESLSQLWNYTYEGAMLRYLQSWIDQLRWQRLKPMEKLARMLLDHLHGILHYCRIKVPMGVIEAVTATSKLCCDAAAVIAT